MNYQAVIKETAEELSKLEKETKDLKGRDRVRFLRLLKIGEAVSQNQAGTMIGIKIRQSQRLWRRYQAVGVEEFIKNQYQGRRSKLSASEKSRLEERLKKDDVMSLQQVRDYLAAEFGVRYTIGGVSYVFKQMKVKLKTGRPSNINQKAAATEAFKKNSEFG
jgi:transposase